MDEIMGVHVEEILNKEYGEYLKGEAQFIVQVQCGKCKHWSRHADWYEHRQHKCPACGAVIMEVRDV